MLLTDIYVLHIAFTKLLLGRLINPLGFWWLLVRLLPLAISRPCSFPSATRHLALQYLPGSSAPESVVILSSLCKVVCSLIAHCSLCCHRRYALQKGLAKTRVETCWEGWEGRIAGQLLCKKLRNSLTAVKILNNLFTRGWMTTKRHHSSDFQWYLLEREGFAWRGYCMPDLWLQTGLPCAYSPASSCITKQQNLLLNHPSEGVFSFY